MWIPFAPCEQNLPSESRGLSVMVACDLQNSLLSEKCYVKSSSREFFSVLSLLLRLLIPSNNSHIYAVCLVPLGIFVMLGLVDR